MGSKMVQLRNHNKRQMCFRRETEWVNSEFQGRRITCIPTHCDHRCMLSSCALHWWQCWCYVAIPTFQWSLIRLRLYLIKIISCNEVVLYKRTCAQACFSHQSNIFYFIYAGLVGFHTSLLLLDSQRPLHYVYLWAASGSALRRDLLAFRGAGLSAGDELKGLLESSRGASGLVLANTEGRMSTLKGSKNSVRINTKNDSRLTHFLRMITARLSLMSWGLMQWVMSSAA